MYQTPNLKAKDSSKWTPKAHFRDIQLTEVKYNKTNTGSPPGSETTPSAEITERVEGGDIGRRTPPITGFPPQADSAPKGPQTAISRPEEGVTYPLSSRSRSSPHSAPSSPMIGSPMSAPSVRAYTDDGTRPFSNGREGFGR